MKNPAESFYDNKIRKEANYIDSVEIKSTYKNSQGNEEIIFTNLDTGLEQALGFYQKNNIEIPEDFENKIRMIWNKNHDEIKKEIEANGFNKILLMPPTKLSDLMEKTKTGNGLMGGSVILHEKGEFIGLKSENTDKTRIVLTYDVQNLKDSPELTKTIGVNRKDLDLSKVLNLEDYLIFQKQYFDITGKHLDEDSSIWTSTKTRSESGLVSLGWHNVTNSLFLFAFDNENKFADETAKYGYRACSTFVE